MIRQGQLLKTLMLLQDFLLKECGADAFGVVCGLKAGVVCT